MALATGPSQAARQAGPVQRATPLPAEGLVGDGSGPGDVQGGSGRSLRTITLTHLACILGLRLNATELQVSSPVLE